MKLAQLNAGLFFGTDTGNTEEVGERIQKELASHGIEIELININESSPELLESFDFLIFGIPTWDFGGIQQDWEELEAEFLSCNLSGKLTALYGLGDQFGYGDYFLDAMGWLHERVLKTGATVIGAWPTEGYEFTESLALNEDRSAFCGLAIDEDQQFELTDERISKWVTQLIDECSQLLDEQSA
ncbi:flavodoxin [Reinekea marinisedimentorum]|uniref:Flavodoxin n=1 Tax=Reinekea marinisedimentorum TaxID=230495 RepID=A0A4R3HVZ7_9GAMM|nr:flavodoxin [Reinekea marinisedimentorum]TCS36743.1 flavodoxin I/flavodoxin II [Reinekea marinisedimentorum]